MGSYYRQFMKSQEAAKYLRLRTTLRVGGWSLLGIAAIFVLIGISQVRRSTILGENRFPWGLFVGVPMGAAGVACLRAGYLKLLTSYVAGETTPPVTDSYRYMAEELRPSMRAIIHSTPSPQPVAAEGNPVERMKQLEALRQQKLISEEEYTRKRAEILKRL